MILSMVSGAGVVCAGLWMLWGKRVFPDGPSAVEGEDGPVAQRDAGPAGESEAAGPGSVRERFSDPTRLAIGVSLLIAGYHIAAWGSPDSWFGVKVPKERWWLLACGLPVAVGASLAVDRLEKKDAA